MKLKPLHNDILITSVDVKESSVIHIMEKNKNGQKPINYFRVLAIGPEVVNVAVDDVILLQHSDHMTPVNVDGVRITITSEDKVIGILEK